MPSPRLPARLFLKRPTQEQINRSYAPLGLSISQIHGAKYGIGAKKSRSGRDGAAQQILTPLLVIPQLERSPHIDRQIKKPFAVAIQLVNIEQAIAADVRA